MEERNVSGELIDIKLRAIKKVAYDSFVSFLKKEIKDDPDKFFNDYFHGHVGFDSEIAKIADVNIGTYVSNKRLSDADCVALFVTFSPDPNLALGFTELHQLGLKVCKPGKGLLKSYLTIEQRGEVEDDAGIGAHFHALVLLNKEEQMGQYARQVKRINGILSKYQTTSTHFLDIKKVSSQKLQSKIDYVTGKKDDPEKHQKMSIDSMWREAYAAPLYWEI